MTIPTTTSTADPNISEATTPITAAVPTSDLMIGDLTIDTTHQATEKITTESDALTTGDTAIEDTTASEKIDCEVTSSNDIQCRECPCPACECEINHCHQHRREK